MRNTLSIIAAFGLLAACGQSADNGAADQAAANKVEPKKKATHCFFKDAEMKGWSAARGKDGNITVKGKVYRSDSRYKVVFGEPVIDGTAVELSPTLQQNSAAYGAPDDWWDVSSTVPNSAAIDTVRVTCGSSTLADIKVATKG
jgi:hypothetical protein